MGLCVSYDCLWCWCCLLLYCCLLCVRGCYGSLLNCGFFLWCLLYLLLACLTIWPVTCVYLLSSKFVDSLVGGIALVMVLG